MKWKNRTLFISLLLITFSSKSFSTEENKNPTRFSSITFENQTLLHDTYTKLEWVNGKNEKNHTEEANTSVGDGCTSFDASPKNGHVAIKEKSEKYCQELTFASYNDWRIPSDREYQILMRATLDANISLYYTSESCNHALGLNKNKLNIINIQNAEAIGKITEFKNNNKLTCLRCVRDVKALLAP